jgi:hypothetical protein
MTLDEQIVRVESRRDVADFIACLRADLRDNPQEWENLTLDDALDAMEAWIRDTEGQGHMLDMSHVQTLTWRNFAKVLYAAKFYE